MWGPVYTLWHYILSPVSYWEHVEVDVVDAVGCICHLNLGGFHVFLKISVIFNIRAHMSFPFSVNFAF